VVVVVSASCSSSRALVVAVADVPAPLRDAGGFVAGSCTAVAAPVRPAVEVVAHELRDREHERRR
jgi:hypothetical protein